MSTEPVSTWLAGDGIDSRGGEEKAEQALGAQDLALI